MLKKILTLLFGDKKVKDIKKLRPIVAEINKIAEEYEKLSDQELMNKTWEFRKLLHAPTRVGRKGDQLILCDMLTEALASHPDVEDSVFTMNRRDIHEGKLVAFVKVKSGSTANADLAMQIRGGMARFGPGLAPDHVLFVDQFLYKEENRRNRLDFHTMQRIAETAELPEWKACEIDSLRKALPEEEPAYTIQDILPDAFAALKESCRRHIGKKWMAGGNEVEWNMVPYDVQLMGAIALSNRSVSEMATGEGKTLTAIMPLYLYALAGKGAHLVTVNDYLAKRDSEWNAPIFQLLGMRVDCIDRTESYTMERRGAYLADITYGTNSEFGFDYLRDNMAPDKRRLMQRGHFFAIIDEADSVMIDEARTPLIISGPVDRSTDQYSRILPQIRALVDQQTRLVNDLVTKVEKTLDEDPNSYEAGIMLVQAYKGAPKNRRLQKLRQDSAALKLADKVELDFMREKKTVKLYSELYYVVDEKNREVDLTEKGRTALSPKDPRAFVLIDLVEEFAKIEQMNLPEEDKTRMKAEKHAEHDRRAEDLHAIQQLLQAFSLKQKDVDYVVEENKVVIVDEFTGRKMTGRRWSDGLHQAVEAKEGVTIEKETQTLATVTIQNYFRLYQHLAGMTGTAETEAAEFMSTYSMDVVVIPANKPTRRKDLQDWVFKTKREKFAAVLDEVERLHKMGLPILVGTASVHTSEALSKMLQSRKLPHEVLNAKNHTREAQIVRNAGQVGAITIATNMAGRGTDIKLGSDVPEDVAGEEKTPWPGGLQIIGTERHEARRIDRQLRGRSGRQGDPGTSRFFISLEDDLIQWFMGDRIGKWMDRVGLQEGEVITHPLVTMSIERAQKKVESLNHERRKRTLQFDNVMNEQRLAVYGLRREIITEDDLEPVMIELFGDALMNEFQENYGSADNMGEANVTGFVDWVQKVLVTQDLSQYRDRNHDNLEALVGDLMQEVIAAWQERSRELGSETITRLARYIVLSRIDTAWQDHLLAIDEIKDASFLRSYGQKDPVVEYTREATILFKSFMLDVHKQVLEHFFRAQVQMEGTQPANRVMRTVEAKPEAMSATEMAAAQAAAQSGEAMEDYVRDDQGADEEPEKSGSKDIMLQKVRARDRKPTQKR